MLTDGHPTDPPEQIDEVSERLKLAEKEKRVAVFSVSVESANMARLRVMSIRPPLRLVEMKFGNMFVWLSQSMSRVSRSRMSDEVDLDVNELMSWAKV